MENPDLKSPSSPSISQAPDTTEPEAKKLKMSTTTTSDDEQAAGSTTAAAESADGITRKPKYKRRKIAIFFAYCGVGYQGMQKNPGARTIEGEFEEALFHSGAVPEDERGNPRRYDWARSARTDKGVSAVGQVVSGRFYVDPPGFVERLNSNLPSQIRVFGYRRATPSFNAKKFCDRRRYVYLIPVFALDPSSHRDRGSVMASLGSGQEYVKCLECSERGRKVFGVMGKRSFELKSGTVRLDISSNSGEAVVNSETVDVTLVLNGTGNVDSTDSAIAIDTDSKMEESKEISDVADDSTPNEGSDFNGGNSLRELSESIEEEKVIEPEKLVKESEFCYGENEKERFNRILNHYVGTHNFHNFTTRTKAEDPAAKRYIISFHANATVNVDGIEFVKCEVVGQSFMLHQIRKMIGLAVAIMRDCASESLIETAFQKDVNITVPMAPEVGLYLDECFFTSYNHKWKDTHEALSMKGYEEEAEDFKMKYIYSHIASMEHKEGVVGLWLHSLNHRNYPDLHVVNNADTKDEIIDLAESNKDNSEAEAKGDMASDEISTLENAADAYAKDEKIDVAEENKDNSEAEVSVNK